MKQRRTTRRYLQKIKLFFVSWKKLLALFISLAIGAIAFPILLHLIVAHSNNDRIYSNIEEVPERRVAIVFGAAVWGNEPSDVLKDRIQAGVDLYKAGKVQKLIMSGDNRFENYDEPTAMVNMAKDLGVPESALQPDYAGRRTYDTCIRAHEIFELDEAILVTQAFHMDRALYLCNQAGIDSLGYVSDYSSYPDINSYKIRDYLALVKALWDTKVDSPDNVVKGDTIEL